MSEAAAGTRDVHFYLVLPSNYRILFLFKEEIGGGVQGEDKKEGNEECNHLLLSGLVFFF